MIGLIGAGSIAMALLRGMLHGGLPPSNISAYDINTYRLDEVSGLGVTVFTNLSEIAKVSDILILAVKPKDCASVLQSLSKLEYTKSLVSFAVGWTQIQLACALPTAMGIARVMPNTPALVGEAVLAINENHTLDQSTQDMLINALSYCGQVVTVPETLFDAVISLSGSGPAYAYVFMEAMADAGVLEGLPRQLAYTLAAQTLRGAATMLLQSGEHPGKLKDAVCSPGGTTIEAIAVLERTGFRTSIIEAVHACAAKSKKLSGDT